MSRFSGVWPAMVTPLDGKGHPSVPAIEALVDVFVDQELDGLYVTGSTGQWPMLSMANRRQVVEHVV